MDRLEDSLHFWESLFFPEENWILPFLTFMAICRESHFALECIPFHETKVPGEKSNLIVQCLKIAGYQSRHDRFP